MPFPLFACACCRPHSFASRRFRRFAKNGHRLKRFAQTISLPPRRAGLLRTDRRPGSSARESTSSPHSMAEDSVPSAGGCAGVFRPPIMGGRRRGYPLLRHKSNCPSTYYTIFPDVSMRWLVQFYNSCQIGTFYRPSFFSSWSGFMAARRAVSAVTRPAL